MASAIDWALVWPNGPVTNDGSAVPKEEPWDVKYTRAVAIGIWLPPSKRARRMPFPAPGPIQDLRIADDVHARPGLSAVESGSS